MNLLAVMTELKRNPSKVWWGNDNLEFRETSSSPGSQDSGFSDTETPSKPKHNEKTSGSSIPPNGGDLPQNIPNEIFKESCNGSNPNLTVNYKEKSIPEKNKLIGDRLVRSEGKPNLKTDEDQWVPMTEPRRRHRFLKNTSKVSRNLFNCKQKEFKHTIEPHQYAKEVQDEGTNTNELATVDHSYAFDSDRFDFDNDSLNTRSLPAIGTTEVISENLNKSAPAVLENSIIEEEDVDFNSSLSSDCNSELEGLFHGAPDLPKYTSTPKAGGMYQKKEKLPLKLFLKYHNDRVPPIHIDDIFPGQDNKSVQQWLEEVRNMYEQECMTTLQCKSIAAELNQKVSNLATSKTIIIRGILAHSRCIQREYENTNGETKHIDSCVQSLTGNIIDFLKNYTSEINSKILKLCDEIRLSKSESSLAPLSVLFSIWNDICQDLLMKEVVDLVNVLESPRSELELRAVVIAITSIALRNEDLIEMFTRADVIPILLILCEKCEGSSLRSLILRALATMCCNSSAVRQFEKFSGLQIITDTLEEESRPEPERSEAVALLAQVTAPWLEDNQSVKGLKDYSKKLVKYLTRFASQTKCCQNLLLCAAGLANLSTMDSNTVKYAYLTNSARVMLEAVTARGPRASIYLLEQVATLIANMSALEVARKQLTECKAPTVLLSFLKSSSTGEDVEKRLQQKSIIGLSRLCGYKMAAQQVIENGGIEKLVKMCRDRKERYDSDAVLVAALATLRKVADTCGTEVLSAQDAQELVEPKLLDSFLAYSTQNESYV